MIGVEASLTQPRKQCGQAGNGGAHREPVPIRIGGPDCHMERLGREHTDIRKRHPRRALGL